MKETGIVYDWSKHTDGPTEPVRLPVEAPKIDDETLRDGLQGTQLKNPENPITLHEKKIYLELASPFVDHFDISYPNTHDSQQRQAEELIRFAIEKNLGRSFSLAGRAAAWEDIKPMLDIFENTERHPLRADIFLDGSIHRARFEGWDRKELIDTMATNIKALKQQGMQVMFVAERATATHPDELKEVLTVAADSGADTLCIADTQGRASPIAIIKIARWTLENIGSRYPQIEFDAHCHNHLGMAVANSLTAVQEGFNEVHGTVLWLGEGPGNTDNGNLLIALVVSGYLDRNIEGLKQFYKDVSELVGIEIPVSAPAVGESAHKTSSGLHARALEKQEQTNEAVEIYLPYPPELVGAKASVEIGPMSSGANVRLKLKDLNEQWSVDLEKALLSLAKEEGVILSNDTIRAVTISFRSKS